MGGIGKTQTALAYAHRYRRQYRGVYWISAETAESLQAGIVALAPLLDPPVPAAPQQEAALEAVLEWFAAHADWLVILDNADDLPSLAETFPPRQNGRLLITTRTQATAQWAEPIPMAKFSVEAGALLLLRRARILAKMQPLEAASAEDRQAALALSAEVDGLPLALAQAGAYIEKMRSTPEEYLRFYRQRGLELLDEAADRDHKSVTITFSLALRQIETLPEIGRAAAQWVRLCAFLSPDAIPEEIFTSGQFALDGLPAPLSESDYLRVRAAALDYSLLGRDAAPRTLSIHRLVQEVIRQSMTEVERREWTRRAIHAVNAISPDPVFDNFPDCERLLPHWRVGAKRIEENAMETEDAACLMEQAGYYLSQRAQYAEAEIFLIRALALHEKVYGAEHGETVICLKCLGILYMRQGRFAETTPLFERAVAICYKRKELGAEHPDTADNLQCLAISYWQMQRLTEAQQLLQRALTIFENTKGPEHPETATTLGQLASVSVAAGAPSTAEPLYKRAIAIFEKSQGPEHPDTAFYITPLAKLYNAQARYKEAETLLLRSSAINEAKLGLQHPNTGHSLWGLAVCLWKQGRAQEAHPLFLRARASFAQSLDSRHIYVVEFLKDYAEFLEETGRKEEAAHDSW